MKFRKKPVVIEAVRWRGYSSGLGITTERPDTPVDLTLERLGDVKWEPLPSWLSAVSRVVTDEKWPGAVPAAEVWRDGEDLWIGTLEGAHKAEKGDWIIRGVKGELYPCKPDIFELTYEPVEDQPMSDSGTRV